MKYPHLLLLSFLIICVFTTCKKEKQKEETSNGNKIKTTITGQVIDQAGKPLSNVFLQIGSESRMSDVNGVFLFKNIEVEDGRVYAASTKVGYFKSGRNIYPLANEASSALIMMIPLKVSGNINASTGGVVTTSEGLEISLPANAIKGGYSDIITVATHVYDPTSDEFLLEIPGK